MFFFGTPAVIIDGEVKSVGKVPSKEERPSARSLIRGVVDACADCDICRFLMKDSCLFFPELYRLHDREKDKGIPPAEAELERLADLCTLCGLCPCPNIRTDIVRFKAARVRERGLPMGLRMLADVQGVGRLGSRFPRLINAALRLGPAARTVKHVARITQKRDLPALPAEDFFSWSRRKNLARKPDQQPAAAYFAGCTAGYLFPGVARAAVKILEKNGLPVYVPPQQCCGMPTLLEGEASLTHTRVENNLASLLAAADAGADEIRIPGAGPRGEGHTFLRKSIYGKILKDNPNFAGIDPLARIRLSEKLFDMGQYLVRMHREGRFDTNLGRMERRMAYFAPCHQREQNIGSQKMRYCN